MKKYLLVAVMMLMLAHTLYAISPVQFLQLSVKDEGMMRESAKKGLMFTGVPLVLGGVAVEGSSAKDIMLIIGGISIAESMFYDNLPFANDLKTKYDLQKDTMNDETAMKILKEEKDRIELSRKIGAVTFFIASLFNYDISNNATSRNDGNIAIKSLLIGTAIGLWFNQSINQRMIGSVLSEGVSTEAK